MLSRMITVSALLAVLTVPALAQGPRGPRAGSVPEKVIESVQKALNLNATQVAGLTGLIQTRRQEVQSLAQESRAKAQAVRNLLEQSNPNPTELGNAILAMRAEREKRQGIQDRFQAAFKALLDPGQLLIFNALQNAGANMGPFRALGLMGGAGGGKAGAGLGKLGLRPGLGQRR